MTDQYTCQSYYDDNGVLHDYTCGKCAVDNPTPTPQGSDIEADELPGAIVNSVILGTMTADEAVEAVESLLAAARKEKAQTIITIRYDIKDSSNYRELSFQDGKLFLMKVVVGVRTIEKYVEAELQSLQGNSMGGKS